MSELLENKIIQGIIIYLIILGIGSLILHLEIKKAWTEDPNTGLLIDPKKKIKND